MDPGQGADPWGEVQGADPEHGAGCRSRGMARGSPDPMDMQRSRSRGEIQGSRSTGAMRVSKSLWLGWAPDPEFSTSKETHFARGPGCASCR